MPYENIKYEVRDQIAYVTIDRPKVLNALNMATMQELRDAFTQIKNAAAHDVRVVILSGGGEKAFVAGADINELAKNDAVAAKEYTHKGQAVLDLIENCGKPVIACVNGFALGGGCEIAMACTMRLATPNAKFGQPEVKLGIIPGYGGTQRLPRLVGKGIAAQLLLTGDMITAHEAHRIGLVNEIADAGEGQGPAEHIAKLIARAEEIARKIISMAPLAIQYTLEAVNHGYDLTLQEGLFLEATLFSVCCATEDKKEGTTAFLEKRAANFQGK
jgi:enoyl-CoA hydratase